MSDDVTTRGQDLLYMWREAHLPYTMNAAQIDEDTLAALALPNAPRR